MRTDRRSCFALIHRAVKTDCCRRDTGTGKINGQEGSATLVRPFLVAGAKAVVANLWSADDDFTRTLMKEFYSQLESGLDVGSALTQAKLRLTGRYGKAAPPRLWAGFIAVGDGLRILSNAYESKHCTNKERSVGDLGSCRRDCP